VWAYLGMYPETPGAPVLALGAPVFPQVTIHTGSGHQVVLSAGGASKSTYVHGLRVNGKTWSKDWLPAPLIVGSSSARNSSMTHLSFDMSGKPDTSWATAPKDSPPSFSE